MGDRVRITDVSPRDGLQNEPGVIDTAEKIHLVEMLASTGVDEVEITSFVNPSWVPQLADAADVAEGVRTFVEGVRMVTGVIPREGARDEARGGLPVFSVLVPNERGFDAALEVHERGLDLKAAMFTAASETFSRRNTNASIDETLERFRPIVPRAIEAGMPMRFYVSCAVACPYEGPVSPAQVAAVSAELLDLVPDGAERGRVDLDLGDTIGVAHPDDIAALLGAMTDRLGDGVLGQTTLHLHDTHGRAAACVKTALGLGVRSFDGSVAGLGGCPFASTDGARAPGNIATETLVSAVHEAGHETGVDLDLLREAAAHARRLVERARAGGSG
jgi:hydroxymethylglutaryl-CoA lyase